ncbi:hypothetical protein N7474_000263 [Penicillium riverlandense]|uniref:uncharacterized protein n=1 Tax=Penicillium riverlandense TaxID=1903569 RepID=UPI002547C809|nr:uncharacterized protein N7474_000263 [Penicillium riverlandense]KAJ5831952.1 hypothetical protein N7474_000263 [Penicillium riverlandense]
MSSPPPYQTPTNPLKRQSISSASQPFAKKSRMHPLRQTSFPTSADAERGLTATSDAGSVTGSFTGSIGDMSADGVFAGAARGKKRGRKSKAEKEREREDASRMGSVDVEGSVRAGPSGGAGGPDDGDEDEDDDEGELLGREEGTTDTEAEKKNLAVLVDAFNPMQSERYDLFKRAKLRKESLRRIVNHALSQSVPASVVTTVNGFTKVFAGEIIEKARTVQAEWAVAYDQASRAAFEAEEAAATSSKVAATTPAPGSGSAPVNNGVKKESPGQDRTTPSAAPAHDSASPPSSSPAPKNAGAADSSASPAPVRPKREFRPPPNPHRGQLLPSHLREALRRTKRDGEDGGVGFSGLSLENLGVRGAFTWNSGSVGGRRLFR